MVQRPGAAVLPEHHLLRPRRVRHRARRRKAYFDKPVEQLTVAEGALLAALIQQPSGLDPAVDPEGSPSGGTGCSTAWSRSVRCRPPTVRRRCSRRRCRPTRPSTQNQTTGPNGLIERQVTKELLDLFDINEQTLNTEGLQVTTTIDPKAQAAAEEAVTETLDGQEPDMRSAVVSIDPKTGGVKAYYGGSDANGFDFAQAGLPTGSSFKVFALVAALAAGHRPRLPGGQLAGGRQRHQDHQRRGRRLRHLQHRRGAEAVAEHQLLPADAEAEERPAGRRRRRARGRHRRQLPRRRAHPVRGRQGRTAEQRNRAGPVPVSGARHGVGLRHARGVGRLPPAALRAEGRQRRRPGVVRRGQRGQLRRAAHRQGRRRQRDRPRCSRSPAYSNGHNLAGGRASAAKTGTNQLGDTGANRDAWMVGFTPSLSTAVWVGTTEGTKPLENKWGGAGVRLGPAVRHLEGHDGRRAGGHRQRVVPEADGDRRLRGSAARRRRRRRHRPPPPSETVIQPSIEVAPGITIPFGPPTTVPVGPPGAPVPDPNAPVAPGAPVPPGVPGPGPQPPPPPP